MNESILGHDDVVINEKRIFDLGQYREFLKLIEDSELDVDLSFMNELNSKEIPTQMVDNFNFALLQCKRKYKYSLLGILTSLSEEFMDISKIKKYINVDVMWELIDELRPRYPGLKYEYPSDEADINDMLF